MKYVYLYEKREIRDKEWIPRVERHPIAALGIAAGTTENTKHIIRMSIARTAPGQNFNRRIAREIVNGRWMKGDPTNITDAAHVSNALGLAFAHPSPRRDIDWEMAQRDYAEAIKEIKAEQTATV